MRKTQEKILETYFTMLFPQKLNKNEYIRLVKIKKSNNKSEEPFVKQVYVKTFEEFQDFVITNKYYFDLYVGLGTVQKRNNTLGGTAQYQAKRHALFLDFDKKDYPTLKDASEFSELIKEKINLYSHMCVNSGNGYHYYFCIKPTRDIDLATETNQKLIKLVGADSKAGLNTQIVRIPTSYNHKLSNGTYDYNPKNKDKWKYVRLVNEGISTSNFYRYRLDTLKQKIDLSISADEKLKARPTVEYEPTSAKKFYCIEYIKYSGAIQGERNFWLGRIVSYAKMCGKPYELTKSEIIKWNERCNPPKPEKELLYDFDKYWQGDYKLLGCLDSLDNEHDRESLKRVCDQAQCLTNPTLILNRQDGIRMAQDLLTKSRIRRLTGYHFLILTLIYLYQDNYGVTGFTISKLKTRMTTKLGHGTNKVINHCMSEKTLLKCLEELKQLNIITITPPRKNPNAKKGFHKLRIVKKFREFENGYIQFYNAACLALRLGAIEYRDYKTYLCLIYHLQNSLPCTYKDLAKYLDGHEPNISQSIRNLEEQGLIIIKKLLTEEHHTTYNHYIINHPNTINGILLNTENEESEFLYGNDGAYEVKLLA